MLEVETQAANAIILDLGLPGLNGMEICRRIREQSDRTPLLVLTARDGVEGRVAGLKAGADGYLVKPYDVRELQTRLTAIMRRHAPGTDGSSLHFENLELGVDAHAARIDGRVAELTRTEYQLLELFMLNPRRALPATLIYNRIWGYDLSLASKRFSASQSRSGSVGLILSAISAGARPCFTLPCLRPGSRSCC